MSMTSDMGVSCIQTWEVWKTTAGPEAAPRKSLEKNANSKVLRRPSLTQVRTKCKQNP